MCCSCSLQMIPVAANDVAFSMHAVLLTAFTLFQIAIYDVSRAVSWIIQRVSKKSLCFFSRMMY